MIFPNLEVEPIVQISDRTRLNATKTFASKDGPLITSVEIEPEAGAGFLAVTGSSFKDWLTDWEYETAGTKVVTVRINNIPGPTFVTKTASILVVDAATDMLFATDQDLTMEEPDILKSVRAGRNSYKDVHREAQTQIVDILNRKGYRNSEGAKITKAMLIDKSEVREMAKYRALQIIFSGLSNQIGDLFQQKADLYESKFSLVSQRQILGLDLNADGMIESGEGVNIYSARLVTR